MSHSPLAAYHPAFRGVVDTTLDKLFRLGEINLSLCIHNTVFPASVGSTASNPWVMVWVQVQVCRLRGGVLSSFPLQHWKNIILIMLGVLSVSSFDFFILFPCLSGIYSSAS